MRYLDQYVRRAAERFEMELRNVAETDGQAKRYLENDGLMKVLAEIKTGKLVPPSTAFDPYAYWFFPDSKFSEWAARLMYIEKKEAFFTAASDLINVLPYRDDVKFAGYCHLIKYVFADGWPTNIALYDQTLAQVAFQKPNNEKFSKWLGFKKWVKSTLAK